MILTPEQDKEIIRVCGLGYQEEDIPTFWRNHDDSGRDFEELEDEKNERKEEKGAEIEEEELKN